MHAFLKAKSIATTTKNVYAVIPDTVTTPAEAYRQLVGGQVEKVRIKDLVGRIASVMVVPYPPGIPVWMPGERLTTESADIRDYLAIYEDFDNAFPGFETEIHGVSVEREKDGRRAYAIYCVKE
jgi:arginine decarboxylase